jgi:1,4-alpha-glucan branching enzyme
MAMPSQSSWGEGGYLKVWLNESNHWIQPKLRAAQQRLTAAVNHAPRPLPELQRRALAQAGRELLLAQSSDWPFILRSQSSPEYARNRVLNHLENFSKLLSQTENQTIDLDFLSTLEARNNIFPGLDPHWWRE